MWSRSISEALFIILWQDYYQKKQAQWSVDLPISEVPRRVHLGALSKMTLEIYKYLSMFPKRLLGKPQSAAKATTSCYWFLVDSPNILFATSK